MSSERLAWLEERRTGIGSSDAPNLLGIGYRSPTKVFRSKTEPAADDDPEGVLARGIALEPLVADMYAAATGQELRRVPLARHPARPWQLASRDRERADGITVECKTTVGFGPEWGPAGSDQVPADYVVQCQHQLAVCPADFIDLAALDVVTWELRTYRLMRMPRLIDYLTDVEERFWFGHIAAGTPPGPDWLRSIARSPAPLPDKAKTVALPDEIAALVERRQLLAAAIERGETEYKRLTERIGAAMGDAGRATAGGWKLSRALVQTKGGVSVREPGEYFRLTVSKAKAPKPEALA